MAGLLSRGRRGVYPIGDGPERQPGTGIESATRTKGSRALMPGVPRAGRGLKEHPMGEIAVLFWNRSSVGSRFRIVALLAAAAGLMWLPSSATAQVRKPLPPSKMKY